VAWGTCAVMVALTLVLVVSTVLPGLTGGAAPVAAP